MNTIYEQGTGNGIGHGLSSFLERFDAIISEHKEDSRAKFFAMIFYDFGDRDFRRILKDQGVFASLDRLSGDSVSIFYLHTGSRASIERFNKHFMETLGVANVARVPCVVFFNSTEDGLTDISVKQLESPNLIHGFKELYDLIERSIENEDKDTDSRFVKWTKGPLTFVSIETVKAFVRESLKNTLG